MINIASQRLGQIADVRVSGVDKKSYEGEPAVRLCNYTDVYYNDNIVDTLTLMDATASLSQIERLKVQPGDVIITKDSETADDIGIPAYVQSIDDDVVCGYHLAIIRPDFQRVHPRYLFWQMKSGNVAAQWQGLAKGVTRVSLPTYAMKSLVLEGPADLKMQAAIAAFLDSETAIIDAVIEKQRRTISILRERRDAAVRAAVETGIPGWHASFRDGGRWTGKVPTDWKVVQLRRIVNTISGSAFPIDRQGVKGETYPFYKVNSLSRADSRGVIRFHGDSIDDAAVRELGARVVPAGSLVMAKVGAALMLGRVRSVASACCIDNNMVALVVNERADPRFMFYALQRMEMDLLVNPGAIPSLSEKTMRSYPIPLPPIDEQRELAAHIDRETARIDALIARSERLIEVSKERRVALITVAVTGQMDITSTTDIHTLEGAA